MSYKLDLPHRFLNIRLELNVLLRKFSTPCTSLCVTIVVGLQEFDRVRERLKEILRQYELRERHFECVVRSKELEVLLSRARAAEQKQLADGEKGRADKTEEEVGCHLFLSFGSFNLTDSGSTSSKGA